jgi:tRNA (cmo5U34)-methyltransferase
MTEPPPSAAKFDLSRAGEYQTQSRIGLAGYDACHELAACILSALLGNGSRANILVVGAGGTGAEIITCGRLEPHWRFTAVDPSEPMLTLAMARVVEAGLEDRAEARRCLVEALPADQHFDAATLIGVIHHLPGKQAKLGILRAVAARLKPRAPLIMAGNYRPYTSEPLLLAAWAERWRMHGASPEEVEQKLGRILEGADPPESEQAVFDMLDEAGFEQAQRFFGSLFWGAWFARRNPS